MGHSHGEAIRCYPLTALTGSPYVATGEFLFHGFQFILGLEPEGLPETAERRDPGRRVVCALNLLHHPELLDLGVNGLLSQKIRLN